MEGKAPTYQDVLDAPEGHNAEIVSGELFVSPRPAMAHALAQSGIEGDVRHGFGRGRSGGAWVIVHEPELWLGPKHDPTQEVLVPGIAGWRRERLVLPNESHGVVSPPDWVCEVLSPPTIRRDRVLKMGVYARVGVGHVWLVDPPTRTIEVFRLEEGRWVLATTAVGDVRAGLEPFGGHEFDLGEWWGLPPASG